MESKEDRGIRRSGCGSHGRPVQLLPERVSKRERAVLHYNTQPVDEGVVWEVTFVLLLFLAEETGDFVEGIGVSGGFLANVQFRENEAVNFNLSDLF